MYLSKQDLITAQGGALIGVAGYPAPRGRGSAQWRRVHEAEKVAVLEAAIGLRLRQQRAHEAVEHVEDGLARRVAAESGHMRRLGRQLVLRIERGDRIERSLLNAATPLHLAAAQGWHKAVSSAARSFSASAANPAHSSPECSERKAAASSRPQPRRRDQKLASSSCRSLMIHMY